MVPTYCIGECPSQAVSSSGVMLGPGREKCRLSSSSVGSREFTRLRMSS